MSDKNKPTNQIVKICFFEKNCWKCGVKNHIYYAYWIYNPHFDSQYLEEKFGKAVTLWQSDWLNFEPEVMLAVKNFQNSEAGKNLQLGKIDIRARGNVGGYDLSFFCFNCYAIFDDDPYVRKDILNAKNLENKLLSFKVMLAK